MTPDTSQSPVYVFDTHLEAEAAIQDLARAGFDVKKLSLVGKGYHSEEHPVGFYSVGDRMKAWGGIGAFWGGIWGLMLAPAVFFLPGLGLMAMAGPLVAVLVSALDSAIVVGGMSALGAALVQVGVPHNHAIKYETALKADKYMLLCRRALNIEQQLSFNIDQGGVRTFSWTGLRCNPKGVPVGHRAHPTQ